MQVRYLISLEFVVFGFLLVVLVLVVDVDVDVDVMGAMGAMGG
jgi:hypothetical protein